MEALEIWVRLLAWGLAGLNASLQALFVLWKWRKERNSPRAVRGQTEGGPATALLDGPRKKEDGLEAG